MNNVPPDLGWPQQLIGEGAGFCDPVTFAFTPHEGRTRAITRWQPTEDERRAIAEGKDLYVVTYVSDAVHLHELYVGGEILAKGPPLTVAL